MENSEKIKIIQHHNNQLGFDCPCVLRSSGKIEVHDETRMPKDDSELEQWKEEMIANISAVAWIENRKAEYIKEGCTEEALIVALWEKVIEGRPEAADALEVKRQAVKEKIKKPI